MPIPTGTADASASYSNHHSLSGTQRYQSERGDLSSGNRARINTRKDATEKFVTIPEDRENVDYAEHLREKVINLFIDANGNGTLCGILDEAAMLPKREEQLASHAKVHHEDETVKEDQVNGLHEKTYEYYHEKARP